MERKIRILACALIVFYGAFAEAEFLRQTLTEHASTNIYPVDIDKDDDIDVLASEYGADSVVWYENDGSQNFTRHTIGHLDGASGIYAEDIDGDLDVDIVASSSSIMGRPLIVFENDGSQNFTPHTLEPSLFCEGVYAADMNGDDEKDILAASVEGLFWYANFSTSFPKDTIDIHYCFKVYAWNMDGDEDEDVLTFLYGLDSLVWYENDGLQPPSFTKHLIDHLGDGKSIYAANLDNNNHVDVLASNWSNYRANVLWYKSDGLQPPSFSEFLIDGDFGGQVHALDMDSDDDVDVVCVGNRAAVTTNQLAWYRNNGYGSFTKDTIDLDIGIVSVHNVYAIDLDKDGDGDIIVGGNNKILWYEQCFSDIAVSPTDLTFYVAEIGAEDTTSMFVENLGGWDLEVFEITKTQDWIISMDPSSFTVIPGDYQEVEVIVSSSGLDNGIYYDTIHIASNDPDSPDYEVPVKFIMGLPGVDEEFSSPAEANTFALLGSRPNPFNQITTIRYQIPVLRHVTLKIYNVAGHCVRTLVDKEQKPGRYTVSWDGKNDSGERLASGIYFYKINAGTYTETKKILFLR